MGISPTTLLICFYAVLVFSFFFSKKEEYGRRSPVMGYLWSNTAGGDTLVSFFFQIWADDIGAYQHSSVITLKGGENQLNLSSPPS